MARKQINFSINPLLAGPSLDKRMKSGSPYRELNIEDIDVDPEQPRRRFDEDALNDLAESIRAHGILCPILVRPVEGGVFRIVAGERRYRAAKLAGLTTVPVVVDSSEEDQAILPKQLVENLQRSDLTPLERAIAIGQLRDQHKLSIREIASSLGVSKGMVQRSLEILTLPEDLKEALEQGKSESKVLLLAQVDNRDLRKELLLELDEISRAELESKIKGDHNGLKETEESYRGGTKSAVSRKNGELSLEDRRIVEELQRALGTRVEIIRKAGKKGSGRVLVDFYTEDDLRSLFGRLVG